MNLLCNSGVAPWMAGLAVVALSVVAPSGAASADKRATVIESIAIDEKRDRTEIIIVSTSRPTFTVFKLTQPTRLFIDFIGADVSALSPRKSVRNGVIGDILVSASQASAGAGSARIEVAFDKDASYDVDLRGNRLVVTIDGAERSRPDLRLEAAKAEAARLKRLVLREKKLLGDLRQARTREEGLKRKAETERAQQEILARRVAAARAQAERLSVQAKTELDRITSELESLSRRKRLTGDKVAALARAVEAERLRKSIVEAERKKAEELKAALQREMATESSRLAAVKAAAKRAESQRVAALAEAKAAKAHREAAEGVAAAKARGQHRKLKALEKKLAKRKATLTRAQAAVEREQKAVQEARLAEAQASVRLKELRKQFRQLDAERRSLASQRLARERQRVEALEQAAMKKVSLKASRANARAQHELSRLETRLLSQRNAVKEARQKAEVEKARIAVLKSQLASERTELERLQKLRKREEKQLAQIRKSAKRYQAEAAAAQERAQRYAAKLKRQQGKTSRKAARVAQAEINQLKAKLKRERAAAAAARLKAEEAEAKRVATELKRNRMRKNSRKLQRSNKEMEAQRLAAEAGRQDADRSRRVAEAKLRVADAQRRAAEAKRRAAEAKHQAAEAKRQIAEANRHAADDKRRVAEEKHRAAEAERRDAETKRDAAERDRRMAEAQRDAAEAQQRAFRQKLLAAQAKRAEAEAKQRVAKKQKRAAEAGRKEAEAKRKEAEAAQTLLAASRDAERAKRLASETERRAAQKRLKAAQTALKNAEGARAKAVQDRAEAEEATRRAKAEKLASEQQRKRADQRADKAADQQRAALKRLATTEAALAESHALLAAESERRRRAEQRAANADKARVAEESRRKRAEQKLSKMRDGRSLPTASRAAKSTVRDVGFREVEGKGAEVTITLDAQSPYNVVRHNARRLELTLNATTLPDRLQRTLDASEYDSPIRLISSFRDKKNPDQIRVVVELREDAHQDITNDGNRIVWSFSKRLQPGIARVAKAPTVPKTVAAPPGRRMPPGVTAYPGAVGAEGGSTAKASATGGSGRLIGKSRASKRSRRYRGKRINVTIKDADIRNVLTFLAKEGGVNIVASDAVSGNVTFHLENVPWDLALDMILKTRGYDYVLEAGVYRVAPAKDIRAEFEAELKKKEALRELKPLVVRFISVNYADLSDLEKHIKGVLSKHGSVTVDQATSTILVKDVEEHVQAAEEIVRRLDVQLPQVLIEARIVEASTSFSSEFGIQWGGDFAMAPAFGNPTGLAFPSIIGLSGGADDAAAPTEGLLTSNPNFAVNLPAAVGAGAGGALGLTLGSIGGAANLNLRLSAAESRGQVKIVSAPKILTLDGNKALIQQGVSIPVPVVSANGVNTQFFDASLKLEVLTNTSPDGNIRLDVQIEKAEPDFGQTSSNGAPTIQRKSANTSLLVRDGETTVIGGIFTRNTGFNESGVPVLSKIPILGWFFKNHRESDTRSELLIFITPRVLNRRASVVGQGQLTTGTRVQNGR